MSTELATQNGTSVARVPIQAGPQGLQLQSLEDMWRFANYVAKSGLAPKGMESPEAVFVAVEMGAEVGLRPMAAIQNIAVVNGRPAIWGDAMLAVCLSSGLFDSAAFDETWEGDGDTRKAICIVRRLPNGKPCRREFTATQAKKAGLWGKNTWAAYPDRMLQMRARGLALRDTFADLLRGFKMAEEVQDYIDVDARPTVATSPVTSLEDLTEKLNAPQLAAEAAPEPVVDQRPTADEELAIQLDEFYLQYDTLAAIDEVHKAESDKETDPKRREAHDLAAERRRDQLRPKRGQRAQKQLVE